MFGYVNHRFLCIATASVFAPVLQPVLHAQVQITGSATHYRSIEGHRNFGSERFDLLGLGTDPDDNVDFMVTKSNSAEECPSTDNLHVYRFDTSLNDWVFDGSIDHLGAAYINNVDVQGDLLIIGGQWMQIDRVEASTTPQNFSGDFGTRIDHDETTLGISLPDSPSNGSVKIMRTDTTGLFQHELSTSKGDLTQGAHYGQQVSLYQDQLLISAPDDNSGTGRVIALDYDSATGIWNTQPQLTLPSLIAGSRFGAAMAIGAETIFIASPTQSLGSITNAGMVDLYEPDIRFAVPECDMDMNSDRIQWIQDDAPNTGELFAYSVEVDEGYAIVGTPYEQHTFIHNGTTIHGNQAGKSTIYERTGLREWTPVAFFRGGNFDDPIGVQHADWLGWSVDIERTTAVAGGIQGRYQNNPGPSGSIRVYERTPAGWIESEEIFPPGVSSPGNPIIIRYGSAVDLDTTANFIAVGAMHSMIGANGTGAGFVLERTSNGWISTDALLPPTVLVGDHIGESASVEEGWAAFGAPDDDTSGHRSGAVHIFKRTGLGIWNFHSTIYAPNPQQTAGFGNALEISRSDLGLTMVVGAFAERVNNVSGAGAGHIFVLDELNDQWNHIQRLIPEFISSSVLYGKDISIDHNTIAVGAPSLKDGNVGQTALTGGVEVYNLDQSSGQFVRRTTIRPEQNQWNSPNGWGNSIGLSGGTVFMGTHLADEDPFDPANNTLNYGAVVAHDIICVPDCPADINGDGVLDFFDISAFLAAFASQDPIADMNGDGVIDFFDVSTFLGAFAAGC